MESHKILLTIGVWILFVAGVICLGIGMVMFLMGRDVLEFGVHGYGGALFILFSAIVAYLRRKL